MEEIKLNNVANARYEINREGHSYVFTLRSVFGKTVATVSVDGVASVSGVRCVSGSWIIPFQYLTNGGGNFRFECSDEEYPYFTNFGNTAHLVYYTAKEYSEMV